MSPLLLLPSIFLSIRVFSNESVLHIRWPKYWSSQHQSFQWIFRVDFLQDWLVWSPCCPRDSEESPPAPQFESINSSMLSLLSGPTLISINDNWKNHSFDYTDLCRQSNVSVWVCHSFSSKEQMSFNFMAAVTVHSDFGSQENSLIENKYGLIVKDNFQVSRKKTMKPEDSRCWNQSRIGISNQNPKRLLCSGKLELRR